MGFWSDFKSVLSDIGEATGLSELKRNTANALKRMMNKDTAEASVALLAWVTMADGEVADEEVDTAIQFIRTDESLSAFNANELISKYEEHLNALKAGNMTAKSNIKSVLATQKDNPEVASKLIEIACYLGAADGDFDASEKTVVRQACTIMGVDPAGFDLD